MSAYMSHIFPFDILKNHMSTLARPFGKSVLVERGSNLLWDYQSYHNLQGHIFDHVKVDKIYQSAWGFWHKRSGPEIRQPL